MKCKSTGRDCIYGDACERRDHCLGVTQSQLGKIQEVSQEQYQHMIKGQATQPPQQPDKLKQGADAIRARLKRLAEIEASYTAYLHDRIAERDHHGGWDCCVNLSEVSCERDGLLFALEALGEVP